jgi:putative glutathione S-transferase
MRSISATSNAIFASSGTTNNLSNFAREIYQLPGVAGTVRFDQIKTHYYRSHPTINPTGIVPLGPLLDFTSPHDRDRISQAA